MRCLNCTKIRIMLFGFVAAVVLGGGSAKADFTFGVPTILAPPINSEFGVLGCSFSSDGLELYFCAGFGTGNAGGKTYGARDIWVATRETVNSPWGEPINLGPTINRAGDDYYPTISPDGLELYFVRGFNSPYIYASKRTSKDAPWSTAVKLGPPVNSYFAGSPKFSADGLSLYFSSNNRPGGSGGYDIWVTTRTTTVDPWLEPVNLGPNVNSSGDDYPPSISSDGRILFFNSNRAGGWDIWMVKRESMNDDWGQAVNLSPNIRVLGDHYDPEVSPDDSTLYFSTPAQPGGYGYQDLLEARIIPIVDFNEDGIVDSADVCIMIENWGENYSLCDIGPTPLGDGIVDVQDLIVLSEYLSIGRRAFVDDDAPNDPGPDDPQTSDPLEDGSDEHPYDSIQEAIDAAPDIYYFVVLLPGTYTGEGNSDITFRGKAITVRSLDPNDSATVAATVIDCQGTQAAQHRGFVFDKTESAQSALAGLTITNAYAAYGAGILCSNNSSPTINRCVLRGNRAIQRGGGMYNASGSPVVSNCIFSGNTAADGGALYNSSNTLVFNCTFVNNRATSGGKIHNHGGTLTLINCILWDNTLPEIRVGAGTVSVTYSNVRGGFAGEGNINVDPLFADPANGDYHLKSLTERYDPTTQIWVVDGVTSPCIDAGDPNMPVGDEPEPNGGRINMGAYGGTTEASKSL